MIFNVLKLAALFYICFVIILYIAQRNLIFHPDKVKPKPVAGAQVIQVITKDNISLEAWFFESHRPDLPTIVFFHGNGGNFSHRTFKARVFLEQGYNVLLAEYRGYGGNSGTPSEAGFYEDARAYISWLRGTRGIKDIVLYGESIGTGTAVQMAVEYAPKAVILETPFSSLVDVAAYYYFYVPVRYLLMDRFDNASKVAKIKAPILILQGERDETVPNIFSQKLFDAAQEPKEFISFPQGMHNNLYELNAGEHIIRFLRALDEGEK